MTDKQKSNYNKMLKTLKLIGKEYLTAEQLEKKSEKLYGLDYHDALEMSYDNIRGEARAVLLGIKELK